MKFDLETGDIVSCVSLDAEANKDLMRWLFLNQVTPSYEDKVLEEHMYSISDVECALDLVDYWDGLDEGDAHPDELAVSNFIKQFNERYPDISYFRFIK